VTTFSSARLGVLFRQRAQLTDDFRHVHATAERLTLEHNELVRQAGQAAADSGRQRAQLQASRKGEEAARARAHADALSRQLYEKETEIADLIGALWAASQPLLSADTIRQLNDHLGAITDRLERADGRTATLIPELNNLRTAINNQSRLIGSLNIQRTDSPDTRDDHNPSSPPNAGKPVGGTP
jgi:chromosome segregation ATPase